MKHNGYEFKYELTHLDIKFVDYLVDNGFQILECKQYNSKTKFKLKKDNIEFNYETYWATYNVDNFLKIFDRSWETHKKYMGIINKIKE